MQRLGVPASRVEALPQYETDPQFTPAERAALRAAEALTVDGKAVTDKIWKDLADHFDEGEILELLCSASLFCYFNRLADALQVEITRS